mgnify:CR=1 FL=1
MFKNYLKVALRNIKRHKGYSFINIAGLAIGMACCVVLFLYIQNELSYDRFHEKADQIYRIISQSGKDGQVDRFATTPAPLAPALLKDFPEFEKAVRIGKNVFEIIYLNKRFYEKVLFADPEIFDVFTFSLIKGNPKTLLSEPHSLVISEKIGRKYFGDEEPVGKILSFNNSSDYKITGVFKNIPQNSHLRFDFLVSFSEYASRHFGKWGISNYYTYVLLPKNYPLDEFRNKMPNFVEKYRGKETRYVHKFKYILQPITRIHLYSNLRIEISPNSDINNIYIFSLIALFILLIACFNYMNLSTARYTIRSKEVGMRKVIGATRTQLIRQFIGETFVISFISLILTLTLVEMFLPFFNNLSGRELKTDYFDNPILFIFLVGIIIFVSFISGSYPAFFISAFQPVKVLKGMLKEAARTHLLRRLLVVSQFTVSIIFIITTAIIFGQLNYMKNKKLGYEKDHLIMIHINEKEILKKNETVKSEFLKNPDVLSVCSSSFFPGRKLWYQSYWHEGADDESYPMIHWIAVDNDFLDTFQIELVEGRNFSREFLGDTKNAYILNEEAVKEIGWKMPLGKQFRIIDRGPVVGVVKNFHFFSLHQKIEPLALLIYPSGFEYFSVRIRPERVPKTLKFLKNRWNEFSMNQSFEYSFLDEDYDNLYETEERLTKIFAYVALLSIFIACLGLFGLASFLIERRTKELGIRKILGASVPNLFLVLSKQFIKCVLVANIIAWPVSYYAMHRWLQGFAYRTNMGLWTFILAGLMSIMIALITVSFRAFKAATANPVDSLRYE